jgi:hypothetical protein
MNDSIVSVRNPTHIRYPASEPNENYFLVAGKSPDGSPVCIGEKGHQGVRFFSEVWQSEVEKVKDLMKNCLSKTGLDGSEVFTIQSSCVVLTKRSSESN